MQCDLLVIGGGSAGLSASIFGAELGLSTVLVERDEDDIGGECLRSGCVPSKALIDVADKVHEAKTLDDLGIKARGRPDWNAVKERIRSAQDSIRGHENRDVLEDQGITVEFGQAMLREDGTVQLRDEEIIAQNVVLATGSSPKHLAIPGASQTTVLTNEDIFDIDDIPDNLIVVGGGPIGCELGQAMSRLGSAVTIVERSNRLLRRESQAASHAVQEAFEAEGINVFTKTSLQEVTPDEALIEVDGEVTRVAQDAVLVGVGRTPNTDGLNLEGAGVTTDEAGYPVLDDYLQTTRSDVYAVGDLTGTYQLSHAANHEAIQVVKNLVLPYSKTIDYDAMSWVTYTDPEVATFGKQKDELDKAGVRYESVPLRFDETDKAMIQGDDYSGELYVTGRTLRGGTVIGKQASNVVQELLLAQQTDTKITAIANKVYPYPTIAEVNKISMLRHVQDKLPSILKPLSRFAYRYL